MNKNVFDALRGVAALLDPVSLTPRVDAGGARRFDGIRKTRLRTDRNRPQRHPGGKMERRMRRALGARS